MAKFKVKNGDERLILEGDEIRIVHALLQNVRLDCYGIRNTAADILFELSENGYSSYLEENDLDLNVNWTIETYNNGLDVVIELSDPAQPF